MTSLQAITVALATIACWRLWNYEDIFNGIQSRISGVPTLKFLWCPSCNAFWISLTLVATGMLLWDFIAAQIVLGSLAIYSLVRVVYWMEEQVRGLRAATQPPRIVRATTQPLTVTPRQGPPATMPMPGIEPTGGSGCSKCEQRRQERQAEEKRVLTYKERVALLTLLGDFHPSYSLTTVVLNQARMLAMDPSRLVILFVQRNCNMATYPTDMPKNVEVRAEITPPTHRADEVDEKVVTGLAKLLTGSLIRLGNATVITHDLLFQSAFLNHAAAIHQIHDLKGFTWLHVGHSCAALRRPPEPIAKYRASLPPGHRLISLSHAEVPFLAAYYATTPDRIVVIPNARDMADFISASANVRALVEKHQLAEADVVQVYPLSSTRMRSKGVGMVAQIFADLAARGMLVRLIVACAHANGKAGQEEIARIREMASGLPEGSLVFTSESIPSTAVYGLPQSDIAALMAYSNVFIFPSISEACPLVLAEAALSGCVVVTNTNVPNMAEIVPHGQALTFPFGSEREQGPSVEASLVADAVIDALDNPANRAKRYVLRRQSFSHIRSALEGAIRADRP